MMDWFKGKSSPETIDFPIFIHFSYGAFLYIFPKTNPLIYVKADVLRPESHGKMKMYSSGHRPDSDTFHVTIIHNGFIVDLVRWDLKPICNSGGFSVWMFHSCLNKGDGPSMVNMRMPSSII